ncbi:RGS domain-containing protein [Phycomyces blakesleeanus]
MRRRASTQSKHTSVDTFDKLRQDRSARKLDSFFGEHLPLDVCISEIRKEGLKAMLESRVPLCYFLLHLINEYSCENLFFFLEIERYDKMKNMPKKQWSTAHHIFAVYMTHNSPFEINVNDEVRSKVVAMIRDHKADHCFDPAKKAVYVILESSFIRFRESPIWNKMISCCGKTDTYPMIGVYELRQEKSYHVFK